MVEIDGSRGEGGGQILRSSLSLSLITGQAVRITGIRAGRSKPGLRAQHLKAVEAAAAVGGASVEGASLGSRSLVFHPERITPRSFEAHIGTAGSTSLVLQTVFVPLSLADSPSEITITGGTHVAWSPCFQYLDWQWLPYMQRIGYDADLRLEGAGFYPQGGGRLRATVRPAGGLRPLRLDQRGELRRIRGLSALSNLEGHVAERQRAQALRRLEDLHCPVEIEIQRMPSRFKGTLLLLLAEFGGSTACYFGLGARGKPAERVADEAVDALRALLASEGAVDEYLADQLLLPLALASGVSEIHTAKVTQHLITNALVLREFLPVEIEIQGELGEPGTVWIRPTPAGPGRPA